MSVFTIDNILTFLFSMIAFNYLKVLITDPIFFKDLIIVIPKIHMENKHSLCIVSYMLSILSCSVLEEKTEIHICSFVCLNHTANVRGAGRIPIYHSPLSFDPELVDLAWQLVACVTLYIK